MAGRSTVVVVDPRPLFRHGVASALTSTRLFCIVGEGATADDAVMLATKHAPEMIVMDIDSSSGAVGGLEQIRTTSPTTRIIVLTDLDDRGRVEEAFRLGVCGYVLKDVQASELCRAASAVIAGEMFVGQRLINQLLRGAEGNPFEITFSAREEQILQLLCQGKSNKAIAFQLSISEKTAKHYLTALMKKLNVRNRVEVALFAARRNTPGRPRPSERVELGTRTDGALA